MLRLSCLVAIAALFCCATTSLALEPIPRRLPPQGIAIPDDVRAELQAGVDGFVQKSREIPGEYVADIVIFYKAVRFALQNGEFYSPKDFDSARKLLAAADERIKQSNDRIDWPNKPGRFVRGFRSEIDDSVQPYGLDIPEGIDLTKQVPLIVWLHGRGDKQCDLQFIAERMNKGSEFAPPGAIVLHPFGRQCLGYKSAGETDVLEALRHVQKHYKIDPYRIALMGFSMGGAGTWHLGAHYPHLWCFVAPGAGFAETARYQKLAPEKFPPWYEQTLWGQYDVPSYSRNLLSVPLVAYSGEIDPQKQAASVMEEALALHGYKLRHLVGPGTAHAYHPETKKELLKILEEALAVGQPELPEKVSLQTRTLKYNQHRGIEVLGLGEHWKDARVDAEFAADHSVTATTANVNALRFTPGPWPVGKSGFKVTLDGQELAVPDFSDFRVPALLVRTDGKWGVRSAGPFGVGRPRLSSTPVKRPGLQGPIDDAFTSAFLVVTPSRKSRHPAVQAWIEFELNHLRERWRTVYRGELPEVQDDRLSESSRRSNHLILWGEPDTNAEIGRIREDLPIGWTNDEVVVGRGGKEEPAPRRFARASHVPAFIYPHPSLSGNYVVINSGPTFREADDSTNSRQNPRLPDWAIVDLSQPPDASLPGKIADADFFDEAWQLKPARR